MKERRSREPLWGFFLYLGARKCHFPRFSGYSFINEKMEKHLVFNTLPVFTSKLQDISPSDGQIRKPHCQCRHPYARECDELPRRTTFPYS